MARKLRVRVRVARFMASLHVMCVFGRAGGQQTRVCAWGACVFAYARACMKVMRVHVRAHERTIRVTACACRGEQWGGRRPMRALAVMARLAVLAPAHDQPRGDDGSLASRT